MAKKKSEHLDEEGLLAEHLACERERSKAYDSFVQSIQDCEPHDKAEAWLEYWAKNGEDYGDQEALVYMQSRGYDCSTEIDELVSSWKRAARHRIEECAQGIPFYDLDKGESRTPCKMSKAEAGDIKNLSPFILRDFWSGSDQQEHSIDATMLRTVEWFNIGGFDDWWERLAKTITQTIVHGGINPVLASYHLFSMCRSNYAIRLMRKALERALDAIEIPDSNQKYPWLNRYPREDFRIVDHIPHASSIVFANLRIRSDQPSSDLVQQALGTLLKEQDEDGAWRCWADDRYPSVEASAMSLHAITMGKPRGWKRAAAKAAEWLWSVQEKSGCWADPAAPDPIYLTVLVLDALELAQGGFQVTFRAVGQIDCTSDMASTTRTEHQRRFNVALSFPGQLRAVVEPIAELLSQRFNRNRVFYDHFYEPELARPNLDIYLQSIYHDESELVVVFLCADYGEKEWCGLEWRAIRDLIKRRRDKDIMFFRSDDATIPGAFPIDGYIDIKGRTPEEIAKLIIDRFES